jgi:O-antigen ligase/Tfp pilus assembly protein PilF
MANKSRNESTFFYYLFFLVLALFPLLEGAFFNLARILFLVSCLPLTYYLLRKERIVFGRIEKIFVLFLFFCILATAFSAVPLRSLEELLVYFAYFIYFLAARSLALENRRFFKKSLVFSLLLVGFLLTFLRLDFILNLRLLPFSLKSALLYPHFGHVHLVDLMILVWPLSIFLFFKENHVWRKLAFWVLNLFFLTGFILSFSRGGLMALVLIFFLLALGLKKQVNRRLGLGAALVFGLLLGFSLVGFRYLGKARVSESGFLTSKALRPLTLSARLGYHRQAMVAFFKRPIFGWGLDAFRYLSPRFQRSPESRSLYAHNHFLQILAETGFLGGATFCFLLLLVFKRIWQTKPWQARDSFSYVLMVSLLASMIRSFFDYDWQFFSVFLLFWVIAAFLLVNDQTDKSRQVFKRLIFRFGLLFMGALLFLISVLKLGQLGFFVGAQEREKNLDHERAQIFWERALFLYPFDLDAWEELVTFYHRWDKSSQAKMVTEVLIKFEPENENYLKFLGDWYFSKGNYSEASRFYERAIELNPLSIRIYFRLIDLWEEMGGVEAKRAFEVLANLERAKGKKCLLKCLGFENEEKILDFLLQLIKAEDFNKLKREKRARIYYWLAVLTTYEKDWQKDGAYLAKAIDLDDRREYRAFLADLDLALKIKNAFKNSDFEEAERLAAFLRSKEKNHAFHQRFYLDEGRFYLAKVWQAKGDLDKAEVEFLRAIEINPWNQAAYLGLADIYEERGEREKFDRLIEVCIERNAERSQPCQERVWRR